MAYESTEVSLIKSQDQIRKLIYSHKGTGISFISMRPQEGFESLMTIGDLPYRVRVMAKCRVDRSGNVSEQEERRVWRVIYWHLKAMFEAADSGVIDIRDVIMPYIVTRDGRTFSEHIVPRMSELTAMDTSRLLAETVG